MQEVIKAAVLPSAVKSEAATGGLPSSSALPKPATLTVPPSISAGVSRVLSASLPLPKGMTLANTQDLTQPFFHGCIYGETSMWKTSLAARFGKPEETLIVLTRRPEQLLPVRELGIPYVQAKDASMLNFGLLYPERLWEEARKTRPSLGELKNLVLDDATEAVSQLLEENSVIDGKEVRDQRRSYTAAGKDLRELLKVTLRKPMNVVLVALAKVRENPITNEETIAPDLPPSMLSMLLTEVEYAFYIKPGTHELLTDRDFIVFKDTDDAGKERTVRRVIFAKNKLPLGVTMGALLKYEPPDLGAVWRKIQAAKPAVPAVKK